MRTSLLPARRVHARPSLIALLAVALAIVLLAPGTAQGAGRITGGTKAPATIVESHLKSMVALVRVAERNEYDGQFCAGTLIDELHVLTAGHCLVDDQDVRTRMAPSSFAVLPARSQLSETTMRRAELVPVQAIFVNPNFNIRTMRYDVAVLRLARPITNAPVQALLSAEEIAALGVGSREVTGLVAGWGDQDPDFDDCCFPSAVHAVEVPLHASAACEANLARAPYVSFDAAFQLCAGRLQRGGSLGADACQGDSGGPLFVTAAGGVRLAGVTSFGVGCGQRYYGVYAHMQAIRPWLESIPGVFEGDTRDPSHGPGDLAAPVGVTSTPVDWDEVRLQITPAATGATPDAYTVWVRIQAGGEATDVFLGKYTSLTPRVKIRATNRTTPFQILVRPVGASGEGPTARGAARVVADRVLPTRVTGLRVVGRTATWNASRDAQSGLGGYMVQQLIDGRWRAPKAVVARRFVVSGSATRVRVRSGDWAGNFSAWSAPVAA